ncbi:MAG TPA: hypothetical protein VGG64_21295 [Pirellulales bacterium]
MADIYIRRGQQVAGPYPADQLKLWARDGRLFATDTLAKDAGGPWVQAATTEIFSPVHNPGVPIDVMAVGSDDDDGPPSGPVFAILRVAGSGLRLCGDAMRAVDNGTRAVSCSLVDASQRRHQAQIEKILKRRQLASEQARLANQAPVKQETDDVKVSPTGFHVQRVVILIAACAGMGATFLPWAQVPFFGSLWGTAGDGWITLVLFLVSASVALYGPQSIPLSKTGQIFSFLPGSAACWIGMEKIFDLEAIIDRGRHDGNEIAARLIDNAQVGPGLYLLIFAGLMVCLLSFAWSRPK